MKTSVVIVTTLLAAFLLTTFVPAVAQTEAQAELKADPAAPFVTSVDEAKQVAAERDEKALLLFYTDW